MAVDSKVVIQKAKDLLQQADWQRQRLALRNGVDACYYSGIQWITERRGYVTDQNTFARRYTNLDPDTKQGLRVTINRVTTHIVKSQAATWPSKMYVDVLPDGRRIGAESMTMAQVHEDLVNVGIDWSDLLSVARDANFRRSIFGTYGIGLSLETTPAEVGGVSLVDKRFRAFAFEPYKLTLDPAVQDRDLERHDFVMYSDAMTAARVRRLYPDLKFDEDKLRTIGQIAATQMNLNTLSSGSLYSDLKIHSNTKGMMVHQLFRKDGTDRFKDLFVLVEKADDEWDLVNSDDTANPFAGTGMPYTLLHGHRRPESLWSIGDAAMLKDEQDRLNLLASFWFRQVHRNAGYQIAVARESMDGKSEEDFNNQFTNQVSGIVSYKAGSYNKQFPAPQILSYPQPMPVIRDAMADVESGFRGQTFRSDANFGDVKTHVPDRSNERALDEADEVLGERAEEDRAAYGRLIATLHKTMIAAVKSGTPSVLGYLRRRDFEADDLSIIAATNDRDTGLRIEVRKESSRYRSTSAKRRDLETAVDKQVIDPATFRAAMASSEYDTPLTADDRMFIQSANKAALRVLGGDPWQPRPFGPYNEAQIQAFRRTMLDPRAIGDPETMGRIVEAIKLQTEMMIEEILASDPQVAMQQMAAEQAQAAAGGAEQGQLPESVTPADLLALASPGGGQPAVPG